MLQRYKQKKFKRNHKKPHQIRKNANRPQRGQKTERQQGHSNKRPTPPMRKQGETRNYGVVFFETPEDAKANIEDLQSRVEQYDLLNIVIRAEVKEVDPDLEKFGKVYCGNAWTEIHERRQQDGWYDVPQEAYSIPRS